MTTTLAAKVNDFLAQKRIAVAGVSRAHAGVRRVWMHQMRWMLKLTGGLPT